MTYIDIQSRICQVLIGSGIAGGNVIIADKVKIIRTPAVCVTQTHLVGNTNEGWFESTIVITCIADEEHAAGVLADAVLDVLDGYGGNGIADVSHVSTLPVRTEETAPVTHTYAMTFRVVYQNNKS
ncbi:MAG TPA: hypothetical protein O0X27_05160 [Methanocorpusculum sp.]|nr:hypothetical protein [Methanocorpusculum sp.]